MISKLALEQSEEVADEADRRSIHTDSNDLDAARSGATYQRRRRRRWISTIVWLGLVAVTFAFGTFVARDQTEMASKIELDDTTAASKPPTDDLSVTVEPVTFRKVTRSIKAVGTLHGYEELTLSSKLEGRVARIHHDLSDIVRPGDVLLELDATDAQLAVNQAERGFQTELAKWGFDKVPMESDDLTQLPGVVSAKLKSDWARTRFERMLALKASNSISADDFEQVKSEKEIFESERNNQLLLARAAAATARLRHAELDIALQRLKDCQVRVPVPTLIDDHDLPFYTVSERMVAEGSHLRVGAELFRLVFGKRLKLRLAVPEIVSAQVAVGQSVNIENNASRNQSLGKVTRISPAVDRATRTLLVEVEIPNEDERLKPGGFAKADILVGIREKAATIPLTAIYSFAGVQKLFVVRDGMAQEYHATLGEQTNEWIEVLSPDISMDDLVVTSGQRHLSNGQSVAIRVQPSVMDAPSSERMAPKVADQEESRR